MSDFSEGYEFPTDELGPQYKGYQLIGDNQFLRFSECLLNIKCTKLDGLKYSGLCVRDQTIIDLLRRIHTGFAEVSEKVVLMIGTNDLLHDTSFEAMCEDFKELLKLLSKNAKRIILLTVPPIPKLDKIENHWSRLKKFNEFIRQCRDDEKIFVGDAYDQFIVPKESLKRKLVTKDSIFANIGPSPQSTPLQYSKCLMTSAINRDKVPPSIPSTNVGKYSPPLKRFCDAFSRLPHDQWVKTAQNEPRRRPFLVDSNSLDKDCQQQANKRRHFLPTERISSSTALFVNRAFGNFIRCLRTPSSGGDDSFTTPSRRNFTPFSPRCPFPSPRRPIKWRKSNSCISSRVSSAGCGNSFTPSRVLTSQKSDSYRFSTTLSGIDNSFSSSSKTIMSKRKSNGFSRTYDNHDSFDEGGTDDEADHDNPDIIRDECFEKYFSGDSSRPDLVHLNARGLCALRGIIQGIIEIIDEKNY